VSTPTEQPGAAPGAGQPSEEELRAAYEAELSRIASAEMILQAAVSLLNIGGYRLGLAPGTEGQRDLEQVRDAVDAVRALLPILERRLPQELRPLRDALSQLQMAYARETQAGGGSAGGGAPSDRATGGGSSEERPRAPEDAGAPKAPSGRGEQPPSPGEPGPGPAESSGRLWVPGR